MTGYLACNVEVDSNEGMKQSLEISPVGHLFSLDIKTSGRSYKGLEGSSEQLFNLSFSGDFSTCY